jgi:hypothetical protein
MTSELSAARGPRQTYGLGAVDPEVKEYVKTARSRRDVPLTARALAPLDAMPARIDT